jgi:hypothetical protein
MRKNHLLTFSICLFALLSNIFGQADLYTGLVGCYPFSGNANDLSGNKHNGIVSGAALTTDRFGKPNSAYHFNGLSDYIAINNFDSLSSTNELSISCWAAADLQTSNCLFMLSPDSMEDRLVYGVEYNGNIYFDYGNILTNGRSSVSQSYGTSWNHYVFVVSQSKNLKQVYVNNVLVINTTYGSSLVKRKKKLYVGAGTDVSSGNIRFHGSIDDIRIYNRSVNAAEVDSMYTSTTMTCTAPSINCLVLCLPFKGNANDMSGNKHNGVVSGATLTTDRLGNPNSAYHFNGLSDYIAINNFDSLSSTNELSISCWAAADLQTSNCVFMLSPDSMQDRLVGGVEYNGNIYFDYGNILTNGRSTVSQTYGTSWNHYVFVMSQSKNLKQVYVNNVPVINTTYGSSLVKRKKKLYIGGGTDVSSGNIRFHGSISDFRAYNCGLTSNEVAQVYSGSSCGQIIGIAQVSTQNDLIKVYPNPSNGQLTIDLGSALTERSSIIIYNALGQAIYSNIAQPGTASLSVDLPGSTTNGIYSLTVQNRSERKVQKLIISK